MAHGKVLPLLVGAAPVAVAHPYRLDTVLLAETAQTVINRLGAEVKRHIFELSPQGYNIVVISDRLGYYESGVERVRAEIRARLQTMMADDRPTRG